MEKLIPKKKIIKEMPDRQTLEAYIDGLEGKVQVIFNIDEGKFEWVVPRPDPMLGQPKTQEGRRWQLL